MWHIGIYSEKCVDSSVVQTSWHVRTQTKMSVGYLGDILSHKQPVLYWNTIWRAWWVSENTLKTWQHVFTLNLISHWPITSNSFSYFFRYLSLSLRTVCIFCFPDSVIFFLIVVLGGTLWHLWNFLQCIIVKFTPSWFNLNANYLTSYYGWGGCG
jgi:hypothetical protein